MGIDPVSLAITVALQAATMAMTAMRKIEGPRVTDLSVTTADYGTPLNYLIGDCRIEVPCFYAEPILETKTRRKTKGGKYSEYKYTGTFAVLVADQEIAAYRRIWLDRRLAYDATGAAVEDSLNFSSYVRFYYGTEDQEPDERMLATIEAEEGAGTCPAHLGVAYLMFEELPLQPFGNRFPQVSVQVVSEGVAIFPSETVAGDVVGSDSTRLFSPDFASFIIQGVGGRHSVYDTETRLETATFTASWDGTPRIRNNGNLLVIDNERLIEANLSGVEVLEVYAFGGGNDPPALWLVADGNDDEHWLATPEAVGGDGWFDGTPIDLDTLTGQPSYPGGLFTDRDGNVWVVGKASGATTQIVFHRLVTIQSSAPQTVVATGLPSYSGQDFGGAVHYRDQNVDQFVFQWGDDLFAADRETGLLGDSNTALVAPAALEMAIRNAPPDATTLWVGREEVDLADLSSIRTVNLSNWDSSLTGASTGFYDPENNALWSSDGSDYIVCFLDRVTPGTVTLRDLLEVVAQRAGMSADDYDFTDFDQTLPGYHWTQGSGKDIVAPLLDLHDSEVRPNGFAIEGLKRGVAVVGDEITLDWFVRDDEDGPAYEISQLSDSDLPRRVYATYGDTTAEHQPNTAVYQRSALAILSRREVAIDLSNLSIAPDDIQPLVERVFRRLWIGAMHASFRLPPNFLDLLPGSVRPVRFVEDGDSHVLRLLRMAIRPNRVLDLTWEQDRATFPSEAEARAATDLTRTSPGAPATGRPTPSVFNPVDTQLFVLDVPLLSDADDRTTPFLYLAAGPVEDGDWPGAEVQRSDDGEEDSFDGGFAGFASASAALWGVCSNALPDALSSVIDNGSELVVSVVGGGTLLSALEDDLLDNQTLNMALIGQPGRWEVVQFRDATLQSDGEWILSGLIRGQRGTEHHMDSHEAGDFFLLVDQTVVKREMGASEIGDTDYYRAITAGLEDTSEATTSIEFEAEAHRPYAVAHLELVRNEWGDWEIGWMRRTRVGGSSLNGQDVPLGETAEQYKLRILNGETVVREETLSEASYYYHTYEQVQDFGSEQLSLTVEIVQMSTALNIEGVAARAVA